MFWQIHYTEETGYITYTVAEKREIMDSGGGGCFHLLILGLNIPPFYLLANFNWIIGMSSPDPNPTKKNLAEKSNTRGFNDGRLWVFECKQITNAEKKLSWLRCIITAAPSLMNSVICTLFSRWSDSVQPHVDVYAS